MARKLLFCALAISIYSDVAGQWEKVKTVDLDKNYASYAIDGQANIYVGFDDGSLVKYGPTGNEILNYSLSNQSPPSLIEPQFQLKTFVFYFDNQFITILDRFKTVPKTYPMREFTDGIVSMACPSPDGNMWIAENNPLVLKKVDLIRKNLILETQPKLGNKIKFMKAYQNILLVLDENGLSIFDQFGGLMHQFRLNANHFTVDKELVYIFDFRNVKVIDPFSGRIVTESAIPSDIKPDDIVCTSSRIISFQENMMTVYQSSK